MCSGVKPFCDESIQTYSYQNIDCLHPFYLSLMTKLANFDLIDLIISLHVKYNAIPFDIH